MNEVSENAKAILLLTAPLIVSKKREPTDILSLKEYNVLVRALHGLGAQPQDLLNSQSKSILGELPDGLDRKRLETLLNRGFLLSQALIEWHRRGIWIISRADASYPKRFKGKLREQAPAVLYGCGDRALLEQGGLAVVGSRNITDVLKEYAEKIGALAAESCVSIVSGAARGIDSSAMGGALQNGGTVIGVMADSLGRAALAKSNREALQEENLVLISAYDPSAGFNVGHAMQRNKMIYALADAGLVVTSDYNKGGTWAGAIEQLEKLHFAPVFVRDGANCGHGNAALIKHGGLHWPEPQNRQDLLNAIANAVNEEAELSQQEQLGLSVSKSASTSPIVERKIMETLPIEEMVDSGNPADRLMDGVTEILLDVLREPMRAEKVAEILKVSKSQANAWLKELRAEGKIEKFAKPVRYQVIDRANRLL